MIIEIGILSAFLSIFLNYVIGKPGNDFSTHEIFSGYTVWLSRLRLKRMDLLKEYQKQFNESIKFSRSDAQTATLETEYKKMLYDAADPFFTWERAFGMCIVCTGFWISLISGLFFTVNVLSLLSIIVISHVVIRLLNKFL